MINIENKTMILAAIESSDIGSQPSRKLYKLLYLYRYHNMQFSPVVIKQKVFFRESEDRTMEQMNSEVAFSILKNMMKDST